jgi:hypothetical protein
MKGTGRKKKFGEGKIHTRKKMAGCCNGPVSSSTSNWFLVRTLEFCLGEVPKWLMLWGPNPYGYYARYCAPITMFEALETEILVNYI